MLKSLSKAHIVCSNFKISFRVSGIMDITLKTKKNMSKDEVALLVELIQSNSVLTSKETNATTNKSKDDTWTTLASVFNARSGSIVRTKEQLKLKWDNLKKAARKRTQQIRMNNLKTGGGKPDFIPPDEILEKVSSVLGSTCSGFMVPFGGDGCGSLVLDVNNVEDIVEGFSSQEGVSMSNEARANPHDVETANTGLEAKRRKTQELEYINSTAQSSKYFFGMPVSQELSFKKGKKKADNEGRVARNLAIARYYDKKTEKLELEIKLLRLELEKKENCT